MSYEKPRITLNDTPMDALVKLVEGNPGAINATMEMMKTSALVDPDAASLGPWNILFSMDNLDLYGGKAWCLYNDICNRNAAHACALLRAVQLGILPELELTMAIEFNRTGRGVQMTEERVKKLVSMVKERLPNSKFDQVVTE